ncbi:MAG TPA: cation:proton antiporter, partial [Actinotalea sp.]|nr:cation:proton antiporter [Actinotalea sp.]
MTVAVVIFAVLVLAYAAAAQGLRRANVTAPIVFVAAGAVLAAALGPATYAPEGSSENLTPLTVLAEVTLALILFHDAAQVQPRQISAERGAVLRLLLIGLPLTIGAGFLAARWIFPQWPVMVALLVAASLAPTDAGLGAATVLNPVVPVRIRRLLNVESGLNDGLVTPVVFFAIAAIAGSQGATDGGGDSQPLVELLVGVLVGAGVGALGGWLLGWSRRRALSKASTRSLGVLALPLLAYYSAYLVDANAFVAAFVAGSAFAAARWVAQEDSVLDLTDLVSEPLGFAVWFAVGLVAVPLVWSSVGWREVTFAVLSLTA